MRRFFKFVLLLLVIAAALVGYALLVPAPISGTQTVLLRPGWSARRIAAELKNAGLIRSSNAFLLLHTVRMKPLKAGEYLFDHPQNELEVYDRLARGDIFFHTVVIRRGNRGGERRTGPERGVLRCGARRSGAGARSGSAGAVAGGISVS